MAGTNGSSSTTVTSLGLSRSATETVIDLPDFDRGRLEDIGFLTAMTLTVMCNYAQTGHFGGPLAYTPYTVSAHLIGPELGGLRYDYRRPKHPFSDLSLIHI